MKAATGDAPMTVNPRRPHRVVNRKGDTNSNALQPGRTYDAHSNTHFRSRPSRRST